MPHNTTDDDPTIVQAEIPRDSHYKDKAGGLRPSYLYNENYSNDWVPLGTAVPPFTNMV